MDAVFFVAGDVDALAPRAPRARADRDVARARGAPARRRRARRADRQRGGRGGALPPGELDPPPRLVVTTAGGARRLGAARRAVHARRRSRPGAVVDTYGAGDSFAAGLTYALGAGLSRTRRSPSPHAAAPPRSPGAGVHAEPRRADLSRDAHAAIERSAPRTRQHGRATRRPQRVGHEGLRSGESGIEWGTVEIETIDHDRSRCSIGTYEHTIDDKSRLTLPRALPRRARRRRRPRARARPQRRRLSARDVAR